VLDAFFFSVQTLGPIGYGVLHPTSLWPTLFGDGGSPFRVAVHRGYHRSGLCPLLQELSATSIQQVATLEPWQGVPTFTFRMVTVRHNSLVDGRTRVAVAIDDHNSMTLVRDQSITFQC